MRTGFLIAWIALWPAVAAAQVLPEGATPDTVVRALGAPRSRSATREREIWLYSGYQVVFEHGRMISLRALPIEGGGETTWQKRPAPPPPAPTVKSATTPSQTAASKGNALPLTTATANAPAAPTAAGATTTRSPVTPMMAAPESGKLALRKPERRPLPPPSASLGTIIWRALWPPMLSALAGAALVVIALAVRRSRKRRMAVVKGEGNSEKVSVCATDAKASGVAPRDSEQASDAETPTAAGVPLTKPPSLADWELTLDLLRTMEWRRFELIVERFYRASGFRTKGTGVGADDGVDIYLYRRAGQRPVRCVQCKAWGERPVDVARVRELFDVAAAQRVPEGVLVTTGGFTPDALLFGRQNGLTLLTGDEFIRRFNRLPHLVRAHVLTEITTGDYTTPSCPRCGTKLVQRVNGEDQTAFWGCQRYPRCHYTMKPQAKEAAVER